MKNVKVLNQAIQVARKKAGISLEAIAAHVGLESYTSVSRKINGKVPWTYEEVVKIGELLGMPDLGKDDVTPPIPDDPLPYILADILLQFSTRDRSQFLSMMGWFLETKAKTPQERAKVKIVQSLARAKPEDG